MTEPRLGLAGRLAAAFVHSKLTPLAIVSSVLLGLVAVVALPREEEPQIIVPMVDVFVDVPGAAPGDVEQRVTRPIEQRLWEIDGVEYLYSTSSADRAMLVVRFLVGEDPSRALVNVRQKLDSFGPTWPAGASAPLVVARSIDDVPVMALTLWGRGYDAPLLRGIAAQMRESLKEVPDTSEIAVIGGPPRQITVELDPAALGARGLSPLAVHAALAGNNANAGGGRLTAGDASLIVEAGRTPRGIDALGAEIVGHSGGAPIRLDDVARLIDDAAEPDAYVTHHASANESYPAVTLTVAKRPGVNATDLTRRLLRKVESLRGHILPADLQVTVTRDYGDTAAHKSNELLWHMALAVISVSILIWIALGRRESVVVLVAIPVTLAFTLYVFYLFGYTLNRITLFALIFSIGILVDDAIVVVENIVRHARLAGGGVTQAVAIRAVDEVGNPTILATLTVVAAILPMAFVGGLMGPYMRPIPVGATAAMIFSLAVAFTVTPWAAVRLLGRPSGHHDGTEDRMTAWYRRFMGRLIAHAPSRWWFLGTVVALLLAAVALVPLGLVTVKMLPFDNKSDLQVMVRLPETAGLETTARAADAIARAALADPAVRDAQSYSGTASPYTFNGLVRHYFLRQEPHLGDVQVRLRPADERSDQSHAVAVRLREALLPVAAALGASIQVVEVPPGPPVLQTLVAEIYGPDPAARRELAGEVRKIFEQTPGVVDVDWYVEADRPKVVLDVDAERAAAAHVRASDVADLVAMAGRGEQAGFVHDPTAREPVPVVVRLPRRLRASVEDLRDLRLPGPAQVSVREVTQTATRLAEPSLFHKNLQPVTYVTGDVAGAAESPVYAILQMNKGLAGVRAPGGKPVEILNTTLPFDTTGYAVKWDGEWHITYEVFRDLGLAFAVVLVLIYVLVVGWFQSFVTPITIMLAIPFSLVGILPAHAVGGAFFTATSMIGFIAGAGIVVRNSIILVDFIELRVRTGMPLAEAVVDAGAVRFRPMALTAAAVVVGAGVILFDPIFQGLAISLMAGEVASLLLSRMTVPIIYYVSERRAAERQLAVAAPEGAV